MNSRDYFGGLMNAHRVVLEQHRHLVKEMDCDRWRWLPWRAARYSVRSDTLLAASTAITELAFEVVGEMNRAA